MTSTPASPNSREEDLNDSAKLPLASEDFYMEGACVVFTAAYHLKRGTCCDSGCRHCPYRDTP